MNPLWDDSLAGFLVITLFLGGGAAYLTGRAVAGGWQSYPRLVFYCFLLALAVRFLHYALYGGTLIAPYYFAVHFVILLALGFLGFRMYRVRQMVRQYPWINESGGPFSWRRRTSG